MKKVAPFFLFLIVLSSCDNENSDVNTVKPTAETTKIDTIAEVPIETRSWIDSLRDFNVVDYTEILDSNLYRNGNRRKMFCAQPKYTRCQDKKWKSAVVVDTMKNYILYQTTNADEEYKVMGYGYEPDYHETTSEDTITFVKYWSLNDSMNLVLTSSSQEIGGFSNELLNVKVFEHSKIGFIDQTEKYLPKVSYKDYVKVPLDSAGLTKPKFLPLTYKMSYLDHDVFCIELNTQYVDVQKKHGKVYNWMEDYEILKEYSVDPNSWIPALYFKLENGKFVTADKPIYD
jgi:hypothetical protein